MRVLDVDDSVAMRRVIEKMVLRAGTENLVEAKDGVDALRKMREAHCQYNPVIMETDIPRIDGLAMLKRLKSMKETPSIPAIICSSQTDSESAVECFSAGAADTIVKPFASDLISERIERLRQGAFS